MDAYQFIMGNGRLFWSESPEPGGSYWSNYGKDRKFGECPRTPCSSYFKVKTVCYNSNLDLIEKANKLIISLNQANDNGDEDKKVRILAELQDFLLQNKAKLRRFEIVSS